MSQQLDPMFKIDAYQVAYGSEEIDDLLSQGYEPYGEPFFEDSGVTQAMVHKRLLTAEEYVAIFEPLMTEVLPAMMELG